MTYGSVERTSSIVAVNFQQAQFVKCSAQSSSTGTIENVLRKRNDSELKKFKYLIFEANDAEYLSNEAIELTKITISFSSTFLQ